MALAEDITAIEARLKSAGKTVGQLCIEAGTARSTWDRWKRAETEPNLKTWRAVLAAVDFLTQPTAEAVAVAQQERGGA